MYFQSRDLYRFKIVQYSPNEGTYKYLLYHVKYTKYIKIHIYLYIYKGSQIYLTNAISFLFIIFLRNIIVLSHNKFVFKYLFNFWNTNFKSPYYFTIKKKQNSYFVNRIFRKMIVLNCFIKIWKLYKNVNLITKIILQIIIRFTKIKYILHT